MRFVLLLLFGIAPGAGPTPASAQASFIVLARHAEKAVGDDPVLTAAGELRARDLATALAGIHLAAVISTQYRRTKFTAAPTASAGGLPLLVIPATGNLGADAAAIARALDSLPRGSAALVVGHSNTLGPLIAALGGPPVADLCDAEFSTLLVLMRGDAKGASLLRSRYGAADPPAASDCKANQ